MVENPIKILKNKFLFSIKKIQFIKIITHKHSDQIELQLMRISFDKQILFSDVKISKENINLEKKVNPYLIHKIQS